MIGMLYQPEILAALRPRIAVVRPVLFLILACFLGCLLPSCSNWSDDHVRETKHRGEQVRDALKQYQRQTGTYPSKLEQLVPKYIERIPLPTVGKKTWSYEVYKAGGSYLISVAIRSEREPLLQATSDSGWTYDTK